MAEESVMSGGEGGGGSVLLVPYGPNEPLPTEFSALTRYLRTKREQHFLYNQKTHTAQDKNAAGKRIGNQIHRQ